MVQEPRGINTVVGNIGFAFSSTSYQDCLDKSPNLPKLVSSSGNGSSEL